MAGLAGDQIVAVRSVLTKPAAASVRLTDEQQRAADLMLRAARCARDVYVGGLAGTGKSTVLAHVARLLPSALLVAPTGKAASVLSRKTGLLATTIHRAIYGAPAEWTDEAGVTRLAWPQKIEPGSLEGRTFLLDEAAMVGTRVWRHMRETGANIVAVGDYGQLPPVEDKPAFNAPDIVLHEIHRQALDSPIIRQAHKARECGRYQPDGDAFRVVDALSDDDLLSADVVLTHRNDTRDRITARLRRLLVFNSPYPLCGEPVVCLVNSPLYGLFNGAVYTVLRDFEEDDRRILIAGDCVPQEVPTVFLHSYSPNCRHARTYLPLIAFAHGYSMTAHKAQGSEFGSVVLVDENEKFDRIKWIYTGITRARVRIVVAGSAE